MLPWQRNLGQNRL